MAFVRICSTSSSGVSPSRSFKSSRRLPINITEVPTHNNFSVSGKQRQSAHFTFNSEVSEPRGFIPHKHITRRPAA
jgi:hypothetical protein